MPEFEVLSAEQVEELSKRRTPQVDLSEYLAFLEKIPDQGGGKVILKEGETQRAVKRRITVAARQLGKAVRYRRAPEGQVIFTFKD